ncbi:putative transcription factor Ovo-like 1 isoform X4 [Felis catus]|uniref:putative transcription factor Ovo-like 1 isoform X4 n=1 Tax=Felis catus TaxID=9685 RepID=UPI001D19B9B3|nr:putative transcription factor Ovo-like 1 isoform X4 [Felis catus]
MRRRSPGYSKLISSDQPPHPHPAPATNTHRREPIKREPVRPARTLRLPERPRGTPVDPGDAYLPLSPPPGAPGREGLRSREGGDGPAELETGARRPGHGLPEERRGTWATPSLNCPLPSPASGSARERWDGSRLWLRKRTVPGEQGSKMPRAFLVKKPCVSTCKRNWSELPDEERGEIYVPALSALRPVPCVSLRQPFVFSTPHWSQASLAPFSVRCLPWGAAASKDCQVSAPRRAEVGSPALAVPRASKRSLL